MMTILYVAIAACVGFLVACAYHADKWSAYHDGYYRGYAQCEKEHVRLDKAVRDYRATLEGFPSMMARPVPDMSTAARREVEDFEREA